MSARCFHFSARILLAVFLVIVTMTTSTVDSQVCSGSYSLPMVMWTQQSGIWSKLSGISGQPSSTVPQFFSSRPTSKFSQQALDYDRRSKMVYWSTNYASNDAPAPPGSLSLQPLTDSLQWINSTTRSFGRLDWSVRSLAVDWETGTVYVTAKSAYWLIGIMRYDPTRTMSNQPHRILFSTNFGSLNAIAVDPYQGFLFWCDAGLSTIERSSLDGSNRQRLISGANCTGLSLDRSAKRVYWTDPVNGLIKSCSYDGSNVQHIVIPSSIAATVMGIALHPNYVFVGTGDNLQLAAFDRTNPGGVMSLIDVDASLNSLVVAEDIQPYTHGCDTMNCEDFCTNLGQGKGKCMCRQDYYLRLDGKTCETSRPSYVYSVGAALLSVDLSTQSDQSNSLTASTKIVTSQVDDVRSVAGLVSNNTIYYGDVVANGGSISRTSSEADQSLATITELTVQQPQVEGIAVNWLDMVIYWSDYKLGHIMLFKPDGRYHTILLARLNSPRGLTIDPVTGSLYWSQRNTTGQRNVYKSSLDGSNIERFTKLDAVDVRTLVMDVRARRIYWTDPGSGSIGWNNVDTSESGILITSGGPADRLYGLTIFQNYITYTNESDKLQFGLEEGKLSLSRVNYTDTIGAATYTNSYDVTLLDKYLQPNMNTSCQSLSTGCEQICVSVQPMVSRCMCAIGYKLNADGKQCDNDLVTESFLLFVDPYHKQIYQQAVFANVSISPPPVQGVPVPEMDFPTSVDIDGNGGILYWIDATKKHIMSSDTAGNRRRIIHQASTGSLPQRLVLDKKNQRLYFTDSLEGAVYTVDTSPSATVPSKRTVADNLQRPLAIAFDNITEYVYWSEGSTIKSATRIESSYVSSIVISNLGNVTSLNIRSTDRTMFAVDTLGKRIVSINMTSWLINDVFQSKDDVTPYSVSSSEGAVYFSAWNRKGIYQLNRQSLNQSTPVLVSDSIYARVLDLKYIDYIVIAPVAGSNIGLIVGLAVGLGMLLLLILAALLAALRIQNRGRPVKMNAEVGDNVALDQESDGSNGSNHGNVSRSVSTASSGVSSDDMLSDQREVGIPEAHDLDSTEAAAPSATVAALLAVQDERIQVQSADTDATREQYLSAEQVTSVGSSPPPLQSPSSPPPVSPSSPPPSVPPLSTVPLRYSSKIVSTVSRPLSLYPLPPPDPNPPTKSPPLSPPESARPSLVTTPPPAQQPPLPHAAIDPVIAPPVAALGPERPKPPGPRGRYVYIPTKEHQPPRGWAPASHNVPAPVKRTWGRAKAKLHAEKKAAAAAASDAATPGGELVNETISGSTLSLPDNDFASNVELYEMSRSTEQF